jgi:hypothetical protein
LLKPVVDPGIECADRGNYLLVTVRGTWTEEFAREVIDTARAAAVNSDRRRILLDLWTCRARNAISHAT